MAAGSASGTANVTATGKTVTMSSGSLLSFQAGGGGSTTVGKISVAGNLTLNANAVTVNVTGPALAGGTYRLMDCTGTLANTGTFGTPTITGTPLSSGTASISVTTGAAGHIDLVVAPTYTMIYNGNTSDGGSVPVDGSSPYQSGSTVTVLGNTGSLTKSGGYSFNNWNTAANGGGTAYSAGNTFTISSNTTLFAQWALVGATITAPSTFSGAVSTTYGTASTATTVSVSGSGLAGNITATSTNSGLQISSNGSTYGSTATFTQSGGNASGTLYVRLAATAPVSGSYNSQSISLASPGATTRYVATTASGNTVTAYNLTLTGATAQNKLYDGTTAATITGGTLSSTVNGDSITATNAAFVSSAVGTGIVVTNVVLSGSAAGNYSLTQPAGLTANIVAEGVWTNLLSDVWGNASNWTNNLVPNGAGITADFSTLDITSDVTVNLDSPRTIGNLIFGDVDPVGTPANWILANNATPTNILILAGDSPTITITNLGSTNCVTISAVVGGTAGLTEAGNGTLILANANTYTGNTTISGGTLQLGGAGQLGVGNYANNLTNNGAFDCHSSAPQTLSGVISGTGAVTNSGSGTTTLSGANTYLGGTTLSGGNLVAANNAAFGSGSVATANGAVHLIINNGVTIANNITINGGSAATGTGLIENSGTGIATLSGGSITISATPSAGGHFSSATGGTLAIADPINATVTVIFRAGNGNISGGGSYANYTIQTAAASNGGKSTNALAADNGFSTNVTLNIQGSGSYFDLAGYNQTLVGITDATAGSPSTIGNSSTTSDSLLVTTGTSTYAGVIKDVLASGTHKVALVVNGGQLSLTGANSYSGNTTIAAGILTAGSGEAVGTGGPLGNGGTISFNGGTLQYSAANAYDYSSRFSTSGGQAYNIDTAGQTVTFATALNSSGGTLTVADSAGNGVLILSASTNSYSGGTTNTGGKLYVNGALNAASAVTVVGSSATLGGQGGVGAVTMSTGGGVEGGQGGVGGLTLTSLAFTDSGTVVGTPNATTAPIKVTASNGLNPAGWAGSITVNVGGGVFGAGTYHLIQYSGTIQGAGFGAFQLGTTPGGAFTYALVNNPGYVDVQVTALADLWTGAFSSEWSLNPITSPKNWQVTGVGPVDYADGQDVLFDDTATGTTTVNLSVADVNPNSVLFNNNTKDYTLQGNYAIAGSIGLLKVGASTVIINNTNSFSGAVTVNAGTLSVNDLENGGVNSPLGAGSSIVLGGGKLSFTGSASSSDRAVTLNNASTVEVTAASGTLTLAGPVSGSVGLTKTGNGMLTLTSASTYAGNLTVSAGALAIGDPSQLANGIYSGLITNNGAFVYASSANQTNRGVMSGNGMLAQIGSGTLTLTAVNSYAGATTISAGTLTIAGAGQLGGGAYAGNITNNAALVFNSSAAQTLSGVVSGSGTLTQNGTNILILSGANTYTNVTTVNAGTVTVLNNQSAANGGWVVGTNNAKVGMVNFAAGSTVTVASGNQIVLGGTSGGTSLQTLNAAGAVNNSGLLSVGRASTIDLNSGTIWNQSGDLVLTVTGGYAAALNVNSNASLTYSGADPIIVSGGTTGSSLLSVDGSGVFTTGAGFVQTNTPTTGTGRVTLSDGGTLRLSADVANLTTQVQFQLSTNGGVIDNNGFNATLSGNVTVGDTKTGIFGAGSLTKIGNGTLTLTGTNTYTGSTVISAGTLALGPNGAIASSPNIILAGGATLDVSAVTFSLGSSQVLSNSTSTAVLNGNVNATLGKLSLTYASGTPALTVTNGTLTLASTTIIKVNNAGTTLALGSYKLVSTNVSGTVAGTVPASVTVGGSGVVSGAAVSLGIVKSELYLVVVAGVNTNPPVLTNSLSGTNLNLAWPTDHTGWRLLVQTNNLVAGISSNTNDWGTVPNSSTTNHVSITIDPTKPTEFYRLVYP